MTGSCGPGEGCGGGGGPNSWCAARNTTGSISDGRMKIILAHEIGHCLGLNHFGGINAFDCMMAPNLQPILTQCNAEINALKNLWGNAVCTIPVCMEDEVSVTDGVMVSLIPSKIPIQGDILTLTYTIQNVGNTQISKPVWIRDFTDNRQLYFSSPGILFPGETKSIGFTWNTTNSIIGEHFIRAWYVPVRVDEITPNDNLVNFIIEVFDGTPPPPPDPIDYMEALSDTLFLSDGVNVTHVIGPEPCDVECLDERVTTLEGFHQSSQAALEEPVVNNLVIIVVIVIFGVTITIIVIIRTRKQ